VRAAGLSIKEHEPIAGPLYAQDHGRISKAQRQDCAVRSEEWRPREIAVAADVPDSVGNPIAAAQVPASTTEWKQQKLIRTIAPQLTAVTRVIAEEASPQAGSSADFAA